MTFQTSPTPQAATKINKVLVANRGEIARRVFRTCRRLNIATVAVFSEPDARAAFVAEADESVALGGATPAESYLRGDAIIAAAKLTGADAIHPGYGFLSENSEFARACCEAGITFVGPSPEAIDSMGSKLGAKALMSEAEVPLLPSREVKTAAEAEVAAAQIGFPVLVKASAGGGGRGMRIVNSATELEEAITSAQREAASAFGDPTIYIERYVADGRHIEVQIFGDDTGRVVHLFERECSVQRRHQKIIEEAPAPNLEPDVRARLHTAAIAAGEAIGYTNAGTVEFLYAHDGQFYFLEVNTRLQVEHPVTEEILGGLDLVELQIRVAEGHPLPALNIEPTGSAIEARIYAEDPLANYQPSTGRLFDFVVPSTRLETAYDSTGGDVSPNYDPMIAKVVEWAPTRDQAIMTLAAALRRSTIHGIKTNRELLVGILESPEFRAGTADTSFLSTRPLESLVRSAPVTEHLCAAAVALGHAARDSRSSLGLAPKGWRNVGGSYDFVELADGESVSKVEYRFAGSRAGLRDLQLRVNGDEIEGVRRFGVSDAEIDLALNGVRRRYSVAIYGERAFVDSVLGSTEFAIVPRFVEPGSAVAAGSLQSAMPGKIVAVKVTEGDAVSAGDTLVVMEAMKMELAIKSPTDGVVTSVTVQAGDTVDAGAVLAVVEEQST